MAAQFPVAIRWSPIPARRRRWVRLRAQVWQRRTGSRSPNTKAGPPFIVLLIAVCTAASAAPFPRMEVNRATVALVALALIVSVPMGVLYLHER